MFNNILVIKKTVNLTKVCFNLYQKCLFQLFWLLQESLYFNSQQKAISSLNQKFSFLAKPLNIDSTMF